KRLNDAGRQTTAYQLTQAGQELGGVIGALWVWGEAWAFGDPTPEELDPVLLMWWMRNRVQMDQLPEERVVVQYDFHGATAVAFWLILTRGDVTLCLTDPGYEIDVLVTADLADFFKLWGGRIRYHEALNDYDIEVEGTPSLMRAFPHWFGWGAAISAENNAAALNLAG
ncbi:MAG: transcriptional regulator, partial [Chloroflexota bacterium]